MQVEDAARGGLDQFEWKRLPSCALERIFSFLNPRDRSRASIVCKSWPETYECPSFWHTPVLSFSKGNRSFPCFNPSSIVQRFGQYFRHLTILCRNERRRTHRCAHSRMNNFFDMMEQAGVQLDGIRMPRLKVLSLNRVEEPIILSENFTNFLKTQTGLTDVDFTNGSTDTTACLMILETLAAENVQHLRLQNFFTSPGEILSSTNSERYIAAITRFHGLRHLSLNYRYLTDEVMYNLAINLEGHLEVFDVLMERCILILHCISADSWIALKTKCPKMRVHLKLETVKMRLLNFFNSMYISPQMPLSSVDCVLNNQYFTERDRCIFDHLKNNFAAPLTDASFDLMGFTTKDLQPRLSDLVSCCTLLENLSIRIRFRSYEIEELFDCVLKPLLDRGTTSLKVFRLTFRGLSPELRARRVALESTYVPKFKEVGTQLIMKMKK